MRPSEARVQVGERGALLLAIGVAVVARIVLLARGAPLWGDEAMLAVGVLRAGGRALFHPLDYLQVAPPLFLLLVHGALRLFGRAEWVLRLPACLAGVATVLLLFRLGAALEGRRLAAVAALLGALTPLLLRYSAEVKPYALDALFGAAIPWLLLRIPESSTRHGRRMVACWLAGMVFGSVAAPVLVGGFTVAAVASPPARQRLGVGWLAGASLLCALVYLLLHVTLYRANTTSPPMVGFWSESYIAVGRPGAWDRLRTAMQSLGSLLPSFAPLDRAVRVLLVTVGGALLLPRRSEIGIALVAPTVLALACSAVGLFPIAPRLLLFALPSLLLCLAVLLNTLVPREGPIDRRAWIVAGGIVLVSWSSLPSLPTVFPVVQLLIGTLIVLLLTPRVATSVRWLLPAALAIWIVLPRALPLLGNPVIEDGRDTIAAIQAMHPPVLYIPAATAPVWLFYSSSWTGEDTARVGWYLRQARIDGAAVPFREGTAPPPGRAEIWRSPGRVEVLGTWPGVVYRPPRGYITPPRPDWAAGEAGRIDSVADSSVVIVETHALPGATDALVGALLARGWQTVGRRHEQTASAIFLHRTPRG